MSARLSRMVGWDPEADGGGDSTGQGDLLGGKLAVRDPVALTALAAAGRGVFKYGGAYAAATGIAAWACVALHVPVDYSLTVAGACVMHGAQRASEGWTWHMAGGRAAERRRRKYQGEADPLHVRKHLSVSAAQKKMRTLAPGLHSSQAFIPVGVTVHHPPQKVVVSRAETIAVFGAPQTVKTAAISAWIMEAPGVVLATSSRADQYGHTALVREQLGEVLVLDADGYGPGTNFAWSPVAGCESPAVAIRRAGALMHASPRDAGGKDKWHEDRGVKLLQRALHAAALVRGSMFDVRRWVQHPDEERFAKALWSEKAALGWGDWLESLLVQEGDFLNSAVTSAEAALGWMDDEVMAAVACPLPGEGTDIAAFLRAKRPGTVYLIGSERPYGALTPYFSLFVNEFLEEARALAERSPGHKLPVPLTIAADEAATTARIDFKRWCTVTAGYNITVIAGFQAASQVPDYWGGEKSAATILSNFTTKVIAGGFTEDDELARFSKMCGERDTWHRQGGAKVRGREFTFPPERLRLLPNFNALLVHRNAKPVQVKIRPVWDHPAYRPLVITDGPDTPGQDAPAEPTEE